MAPGTQGPGAGRDAPRPDDRFLFQVEQESVAGLIPPCARARAGACFTEPIPGSTAPAAVKEFLKRWAICTFAVLVASLIVPGVHYRRWSDLLIATFLLGILNAFVRPALMLLALPLLVVTLGLFTLVINALLLLLVDLIMAPKFSVEGFWHAMLAALVIGIVSVILNLITGSPWSNFRVQVTRNPGRRPPRDQDPDGPGGPVIDV